MQREKRTLLLSRRDVACLMEAGDWVEAVETGFRAAAEGKAASPPPMTIEGSGGAFHAKGASLDLDRRYVALKLNGNFPGNPEARGLPTIQGAILLCDGEDGSPLAIMDSIEVTLRRTAAATALAARYLARPDSRTVFICGCGEQGRAQLSALRSVLPIGRALAWDRDASKARALARDMAGPDLEIAVASELGEARLADIVLACTTSKSPYLGPDAVSPGAFVAAVGADSPEKSEIVPALLEGALVVADVIDQCRTMGDLRHALAAGYDLGRVHASLEDLVAGRKPGRTADDQIALFDSTGTALQDVASAVLIYRRALQRPDLAWISFGAA